MLKKPESKSKWVLGLFVDYPVIDMHAHLRSGEFAARHARTAKQWGIDFVVAMANTDPCNDSLERVEAYRKLLSGQGLARVFLTSAVTIGREGRELVDIDALKGKVVGFTDDGNCLQNLDLLNEALEKEVMVMLHCGVEFDRGFRDTDEAQWVEKYLELRRGQDKGILYLQHISRAGSVDLIRQAKAQGVKVVAETCPHYFTYTRDELATPVNPPLGDLKDLEAVRAGLKDGTIDVIASDYAPLPQPKKTGIAGFRSFIPLSYGLVIQGVLTPEQLKEKVYLNPRGVLESVGAGI